MKVPVNITIDHKTKEAGQKKAKKKGFSFSAYIQKLIDNDK